MKNGKWVQGWQHLSHMLCKHRKTKCPTINIVIVAEDADACSYLDLFSFPASMRITHLCSPFIRKGHGTGQSRAQQQWSYHFWAEAFTCWSKSVHHSHLHTEGKVAGEWCLCPPGSPSHNMEGSWFRSQPDLQWVLHQRGKSTSVVQWSLKFWLCLFRKHSRTQSAYWYLRTWNF